MPEPPRLFRVGLILTERCDVACRHCWFSCGPDRDATMSRGRAEAVIDQARALGASWVSFTGGEPFLERRLLISLVAYASGRGLYTEAVTNCNWARSQAEAEETLRPLAEAGLTALNMSADDFHQEQIPLERVRHCFEAAKELGLKSVFMVATRRSSAITAGSLPELLGDEGIQVMGEPRKPRPSALAVETPFTPVGRGAHVEAADLTMGAATVRCGSVLADIGVTPGGEVLPCCGPLACREDAILGNIEDEPLLEILTRAQQDGRFIKILEGFEAGSGYASRCDACRRLFG